MFHTTQITGLVRGVSTCTYLYHTMLTELTFLVNFDVFKNFLVIFKVQSVLQGSFLLETYTFLFERLKTLNLDVWLTVSGYLYS